MPAGILMRPIKPQPRADIIMRLISGTTKRLSKMEYTGIS